MAKKKQPFSFEKDCFVLYMGCQRKTVTTTSTITTTSVHSFFYFMRAKIRFLPDFKGLNTNLDRDKLLPTGNLFLVCYWCILQVVGNVAVCRDHRFHSRYPTNIL